MRILENVTPGSMEWRKRITATKAVAIMAPHLGYETWGTPLSVWIDVTAALRGEESEDKDETSFMAWGRATEASNRELMSRELGRYITPIPGTVQDPEHDWLCGTPDGLIGGKKGHAFPDPGVWEGKSPSLWKRAEWQQGVPAPVLVQLALNMRVTGLSWGVASALLPPAGPTDPILVHDTLARDPAFEERMLEILRDFWERNVLQDIPPDAVAADAPRLRTLHPKDTGGVVEFSEELCAMLPRLKELEAKVKADGAELESIKARIMQEMGEHTYGTGGGFSYSWKHQTAQVKPREASVRESRVLRTCKEVKA